jgi:protein-glutamine gamma-glutamyltransferase
MPRAHLQRLNPSRATLQWVRAIAGRLGAQWERERRDTLFLMVAALAAVIPAAVHLPAWVPVTFTALWFWRLGLVISGRALPSRIVRMGAAIGLCAAVFSQYETLISRDAGVSLLTLFVGLKLMEMRARRDLFVVLFLCFFVLITGFFQSQSPAMGAAALLAVVLLMVAMVTMQFGAAEASIPRRLRTAATILLQALPLASAMFVLFPRISEPLWAVQQRAEGAKTGLSDSMTPGSITELSQSDEVAFRVKFQGAPPASKRMYWRGPVLGNFDGRTWRAPAWEIAPPRAQVEFSPDAPPVRYELTLEPHQKNWLFALDAPVRIDHAPGGRALVSPDFTLLSPQPIESRVNYALESRMQYRMGLNETPRTLRNWTELPSGFNPQTLALAARWLKEEADPTRLVERALTMFRQQPFRYTLNPPMVSGHSVDAFLFDTRAGFCEHFAGAFVVLMRALDIPARVVTGYQGGEHSDVDDYWIIRQSDAHAWAEVWLAARGWVRVDPVAAVAPQRIEQGSQSMRPQVGESTLEGISQLARDLWLNVDALSYAWDRWMLSYDYKRQRAVMADLGLSVDDWRQMASLLAGVLAILLGLAATVTLKPGRLGDPISRSYQDFCERLAQVGLPRHAHETANAHLQRIARGLEPVQLRDALAIVDTYNRLRFGAHDVSAAQIQAFRQRVRRFKPWNTPQRP